MSLKHSLNISADDITGENSPNQLYLLKLEERLTFERSATQIYEALIHKYTQLDPDLKRLEELKSYHLQELHHCQLLTGVRAMFLSSQLPEDMTLQPTSVWVQVIQNPGTTLLDALNALLQLEVVDQSGWEMLIELSENIGLSEVAIQFQQALNEEMLHQESIKNWVQEINLNELKH